jgi:hypothetical protein
MLRLINLKENGYSTEQAIAVAEIEIENAKREGLVAIKFLHGYGSHGKGGVIMRELRRSLFAWKRTGLVLNYFGGDKWNLFDPNTKRILMKDKNIYNDPDIDKSNPGITIVEIN